MNGRVGESVIVNEAPLSEGHIPQRLIARDQQAESIRSCIWPALKGRQPVNLWIHGGPGTGKTCAVLHILGSLNREAHLQSALINCWNKHSFFEVVDELVAQLRILRAEQHRTSTKLERLRRYIGERPFVVVLDEVDKMKPAERSAAVYNLLNLGKVGLICISNHQGALFELDERVASRLNAHVLAFPGYSKQELQQILTHRATMSLAPSSYTIQTLKSIAHCAGGDARLAVGFLRTAAELTEQKGTGRLDPAGLKRFWQTVRDAKLQHVLDSLTDDHRILHSIIAQRGQVLSTSLYREYLQRCRMLDRKPLAVRTFSNYVNVLARIGLVTSELARVKGKVRLFKVMA